MAKKKAASETAGGTETGNASVPEAVGKTNLSAAVKAYLAAHGDAKPKAVSEALAGQGIKIAPNYVSMIKSKMKGVDQGNPKKGKGKKKATTTQGHEVPNGRSSSGLYPIDAFTSAAKLLKSVSAADAIALIKAMDVQ